MSDAPHVITRDGDLLALFKPSGLSVHNDDDNLMSWATSTLGLGPVAPINRLDRETSGIVLASADPAVRREAGAWFSGGAVKKGYLALVFGRPGGEGVIRKPLSDARRGKPLDAVTRYRCLERFARCALVSVHPETGRKHQIRRHMQGAGHAIVGDDRYRPRRFTSIPGFPGRLWLHAGRLTLPGGATIEAPLPADLEAHLELLREKTQSDPEI